jgi:Rps23 Pro-64 3,4-dihydroxylase Tpa1-like proline 4-hydroxylase
VKLSAFERATKSVAPFPHLRVNDVLGDDPSHRVLRWLQESAPWKLTTASFYEQYEFSLLHSILEPEIERLVDSEFVQEIAVALESAFDVDGKLELVEISAHKLIAGQTIRIHNDFLGSEETHRLLIQLNAGWEASQGGLLMLFGSDAPESLQHVILPAHDSGLAFEISPNSFHAVSTIKQGDRYTIVYTFSRAPKP